MEIVRIFADRLAAFRFATGQPDEFSKLFSQWQDPQYLYDFFTEHVEDLQSGFYGPVSLQTAIRRTREEARRLEQELQRLAAGNDNLDSIFVPLKPTEPRELPRSKATGDNQRSWLRIYAIKVESNVYVITGGAIKLTDAMQDRKHTQEEFNKLGRCRDFLREQGITDVEGLSELII